ncbi:MAG: hypothetical protein GY796_08930 [Chloroflexi bacterium]|nr:hypothetical protein [Chloroflexota bacterium]
MIILSLLILIAGCTPQSDEPAGEAADGDTTAVPPTTLYPPTATATETAVPTSTLTPTATKPPSPASTPAPTATDTPSPAPKPTMTPLAVQIGPFRRVGPVPDVGLHRLHIDSHGRLYLIADSIMQFDDENWTPYLDNFEGHFVGIDADGRVWTRNESGTQVAAWNGESWQTYGAEAGWLPVEEALFAPVPRQNIVVDAHGRTWLVTAADTRVLEAGVWTIHNADTMGLPLPDNPDSSWPTFTIAAIGNNVWVGQCHWSGPGPVGGNGAAVFDGAQWTTIYDKGCVNGIVSANSGEIWFNLGGALGKVNPSDGQVNIYPPPELDSGWYGFAEALFVDADGRPWPVLAVCGGASCYNGIDSFRVETDDQWTKVLPDLEEPYLQIIAAAGTTWVFVPGQIMQLTAGELQPVADLNVFLEDVVVEEDGRLWFVVVEENGRSLWTHP